MQEHDFLLYFEIELNIFFFHVISHITLNRFFS